MTDQPTNNGKKRWGRRVGIGVTALVNINAIWVVFLFRAPDQLSWGFKFASLVTAVALVVGGVVTITDAIKAWKETK